MPNQIEPNANNALGKLLRRMMPGSAVHSETTHTFAGFPGKHPDGLVVSPGRAPVVVEAEYEPAAEVEEDAKGRLGLAITDDARIIEAAIALRYPKTVEDAYDLDQAVKTAEFSYCVHYADAPRFPTSGWLAGSAADLADLIRLVSVPQKEVDRATATLESGINRAAPILDRMAELRPYTAAALAGLLGMADVPQTRRMACAIIANALVFHERIAGMHPEVKFLRQLAGPASPTLQDAILAAWQGILDINYYPIFAIAKDLLMQLPSADAAELLDVLRPTAQTVDAAGVDNAHDLTGRVFQRLIADRKYLATFYTLPAAAALLARLAVAKLDNADWADAAAIGQLRIGDFACGTGALLSAVYDQIAARHERAGGQPAQLHPVMMEEVLYGCDVMPAAIHITGSTLSGIQPNVRFDQSRLYTMPYGRQADDSVKIGSLELLQTSAVQTLFNTSDPALRTGSAGEETAAQVSVDIPDAGFDLVIMNPPFTRAAADWEGSEREQDYIKQFRGLSTDLNTQREMAARQKFLCRDTCYHGYAGIASSFAALADRKIKPGGVLALVLPLTASAGVSWQMFRQMLASGYAGVTVLSNVANGKDMSFSSDTGMGECLVIARKLKEDELPDDRVQYISLSHRPEGFVHSSEIANKIIGIKGFSKHLEAGPYDGTNLEVGDELVGKSLSGLFSGDSCAWSNVRIWDYSLAQTAYALTESRLWLPGMRAVHLKTDTLSLLGSRGMHSMNIAGSVVAPFTRTKPSPTSTYPALWSHDASREKRFICEADSQLQVRDGMEERAQEVWETASRVHNNVDFRFNSQPLTAAFTEWKSMGGRAWPNVSFADERFDYAYVVWSNSTLGLLSFWYHANKQQPGRGIISVSSSDSLPVLDLRALTDDQLTTAQEIFEEFRDKELQPAYLADADPNRALLDRRVICDLLGFDAAVYQGVRRLAEKWCAEPSVHGGKARPKDARLVV